MHEVTSIIHILHQDFIGLRSDIFKSTVLKEDLNNESSGAGAQRITMFVVTVLQGPGINLCYIPLPKAWENGKLTFCSTTNTFFTSRATPKGHNDEYSLHNLILWHRDYICLWDSVQSSLWPRRWRVARCSWVPRCQNEQCEPTLDVTKTEACVFSSSCRSKDSGIICVIKNQQPGAFRENWQSNNPYTHHIFNLTHLEERLLGDIAYHYS